MKSFADLERDYIRARIVPEFEFELHQEPSRVNPLTRPMARATVALVVTAGAHIAGDQPPFQARRRGDPSFREIPRDTELGRIGLSHVGYDTRRAMEDVNVVLPLEPLRRLEASGRIGAVAPRHYSFMGYCLETDVLRENAREVGRRLATDGVDLALLVPS